MENTNQSLSYFEFNNKITQRGDDGFLQLHYDQNAIDSYIDYINTNTMRFENEIERIKYLVANNYYDPDTINMYNYDDIVKITEYAYSIKYRWKSFMQAFKFFNDYAMKTDDLSMWLENFAQHNVIVALFIAQGNVNAAMDHVKSYMEQRVQPATPTYLNAGRARGGELTSCNLLALDDTTESIQYNLTSMANLSRVGAGVAFEVSNLRALSDPIKGIEDAAKGPLGVLKLAEDTFAFYDQLGQREGSGAGYINIFHLDADRVLDAKKINADDMVRLKTLSLGLSVPQKFYDLVDENVDFYTFSPYDIKKYYGLKFTDVDFDEMYDTLVADSRIRKNKVMNAREYLVKIAKIQIESGYPYFFNVSNANKQHALKNEGKIIMSNLCVTGDTRLLTVDGYMRADELYAKKSPLKVLIDNRTKSLNRNELGFSTVDAIPMQLTQTNAEVFRVSTKEGFQIKATAWHKFYVERDSKIIKIPLNELEVSDKLLIQSGTTPLGSYDNKDLATILGLVSSGLANIDTKEMSITFSISKLNKADDKFNYLKNLIETSVKNILNVTSKNKILNKIFKSTYTTKNSSTSWSLTSAALVNVISNYINDGLVKVPEFLFTSNSITQISYLSMVFMKSQFIIKDTPKYCAVMLSNSNIDYLRDIQLLLMGCGIFSKIQGVDGDYSLYINDYVSRFIYATSIELDSDVIKNIKVFNDSMSDKSKRKKDKYLATIVSIEHVGNENVYDTTQEDYNSLIFNGIVTGNCNEIYQLQEISDIEPYNRRDDDVIRRDISCNLHSLNIVNVMEHKDVEGSIRIGMRGLTTVTDSYDIKTVPGVAKANSEMHSVGLGMMNLNGYFAKNKIMYEALEARDFARTFAMMMNFYSLSESCKIAQERNVKFKGFEGSDYHTGVYFDKYLNRSYLPITDKVKTLFDGIHIPDIDDWVELKKEVMENGLYHAYRLAVAPTQSISYVQNSTSSVMPIMNPIETRLYGGGKIMYPMPYYSPETMWYYKDAYKIDMMKLIDLIAIMQEHIDQGISTILYVNSDISTAELARYYVYANKKGLKGLYYTRINKKDIGAVTTDTDCVSCSV